VGYGSHNSYAVGRERAFREMLLRDGDEAVPERALQVIWQHQRLREPLHLTDGREVRVLHPGFWNHEAGPDFRHAVIALAGAAPRRGDVEVDVEPAGWHAHGHDVNPAFANVVLRVVWSARGGSPEPLLPLQPQLDSPWKRLREWALREPVGGLPEGLRGRCCQPLRSWDDGRVAELLNEAGLVRLTGKADHCEVLARDRGWEAALTIGLFSGLGYKRNAWPMRRIAEAMLRLDCPAEESASRAELALALMLGVGGFMPEEWSGADRERSDYLARLWSLWWRLRELAKDFQLPRLVWQLSGTRPVNRPERRLALAAQWLAAGGLMRQIESWSQTERKPSPAAAELRRLLSPPEKSFWDDRCTFASRPLAKPAPLLGRSRLTELAMNAVLPWLYARAKAGKNRTVMQRVEAWYLGWPKAEDNAVLRLARLRLLGDRPARCLRSAGQQQGLLQIVRDFCAQSDALCTGCPFPDHVRTPD
jgi:hypothetical protein